MIGAKDQSVSIWAAPVDKPSSAALPDDLYTDVCVVGAGIAGLTTAYLLAREGKTVIVIDSGLPGRGETGRTTAHLSNAIDSRYVEIERLHGEQGAHLVADSHTAAITRIESLVKEEQIECCFERLDGYLFVPPGDPPDILEQELKAAQRAGLKDVEFIRRAPLIGFDTGPCLRFPRQAQFHPLQYLSGLAHAFQRAGGRLYTGTHAEAIQGGNPARVEVKGGRAITADAVVVATNTPVNDLFAIHTKQAPYRSYVIGISIPSGVVPKGLYWDTLDPYHYVRLANSEKTHSHTILLVGGEDHKTGQADDAEARYDRLESWARERFPSVGRPEYRWSGQVMESIDGLAFIGRNPMDQPNVFVATGDSGMGLTHGTIAGMLLTDLILERKNPWTDLYDPSRIKFGAAGEFAQEQLNVAAQYTEWLTGDDVDSVKEITRGSGAVIRRGFSKVAVYRDQANRLHECSAVCSHLGCIVAWNSLEHTWDCPCHGSRFDPKGKVITGPANTDLGPAPKP